MSALPEEIESGDGRRFQLRETNPGDMLDLLELAGPAAASDAWLRYALLVCSVCAIDGKPVIMPSTKDGIRDLARRIGNTGMDAVSRAHFPDDDDAVTSASAEIDIAKN